MSATPLPFELRKTSHVVLNLSDLDAVVRCIEGGGARDARSPSSLGGPIR